LVLVVEIGYFFDGAPVFYAFLGVGFSFVAFGEYASFGCRGLDCGGCGLGFVCRSFGCGRGGLGFIFIPLSTVAYATLQPRFRAEAASVFSLTRNLGSSIGISLVMGILSSKMATNHAYLTEFITPFTLGFGWLQLPDALSSSAAGAIALLELEITRQAATIAYVNDFKLMMWIVLASAPLVLLMKNPRKKLA